MQRSFVRKSGLLNLVELFNEGIVEILRVFYVACPVRIIVADSDKCFIRDFFGDRWILPRNGSGVFSVSFLFSY